MRVRTPTLTEQQVSPDLPGFEQLAPICDAMRNEKTVSFVYDGKPRVVECHAVGTSTKDGGLVLRGVQIAGGASRPLPQWTLFRLDRFNNFSVDPLASQAPRDGYTVGDSQMKVIVGELEV